MRDDAAPPAAALGVTPGAALDSEVSLSDDGSGRSNSANATAPMQIHTNATRNPPASCASPGRVIGRAALVSSPGPMTAPNVAAQMTLPITAVRRASGYGSAAAYRARLLALLPEPLATIAASSSGKEASNVAAAPISEPTAAIA